MSLNIGSAPVPITAAAVKSAAGHVVCPRCRRRVGRVERQPHGKVLLLPMGWTDSEAYWAPSTYAERWVSEGTKRGERREPKYRRPPRKYIVHAEDGGSELRDATPTPGSYPARILCTTCSTDAHPVVLTLDSGPLDLVLWRSPGGRWMLPQALVNASQKAGVLQHVKLPPDTIITPPLDNQPPLPVAHRLQLLKRAFDDEEGQCRARGELAEPSWASFSNELEARIRAYPSGSLSEEDVWGLVCLPWIREVFPCVVLFVPADVKRRAVAAGVSPVPEMPPRVWSCLWPALRELHTAFSEATLRATLPCDHAPGLERTAERQVGPRVLRIGGGAPPDFVPKPLTPGLWQRVYIRRHVGGRTWIEPRPRPEDEDWVCVIGPPLDYVPQRS